MLNGTCIALALALAPWLTSSTGGTPGRFVETFTAGNFEANWEILMTSGTSAVVPEGGHPGAHLVNTSQCCWPSPVVRTLAPASIFTGDYRALGVTSLGLDMTLRLAQAQQHPDFSMTLMLVHDNGTPGTNADDTWVYLNLAQPIPWPGQGWKSYDFRVPSQLDLPFGQLPLGWKFYEDDFGSPPLANHTWREVMENVSQVWFIGLNDPAAIGFFWNWRTGVDNVRITWERAAGAPPDER